VDSAGCRVGTCTTLGTQELKLLKTVNLRSPQLPYTQTAAVSVSCVNDNVQSVGLTQVTWEGSLYLRWLAWFLNHTTRTLRFGRPHTTLRTQVRGGVTLLWNDEVHLMAQSEWRDQTPTLPEDTGVTWALSQGNDQSDRTLWMERNWGQFRPVSQTHIPGLALTMRVGSRQKEHCLSSITQSARLAASC
jgi:hypothetical protein